MKTIFSHKIFSIAVTLSLAFLALSENCSASEDSASFLAALRERGYHDLALEYIDYMAKSPLASKEFKEIVLYEKGLTMVTASRSQRDFGIREKQLDDAQSLLNQFIRQKAAHPLVSAAKSALGNLMVERARMKIDQGKKDTSKRTQSLSAAKSLYDQAYKVFNSSQKELQQKLANIPKVLSRNNPQQAQLFDIRNRLRAEFLETQLLAAAILEETADTTVEGSKPYHALLAKAAAEYNLIYEKYRTRLAGLYARLFQGRCFVKMKKYKAALSYFADLLEQPSESEALRKLKTETLLLASECWLSDAEQKYNAAIDKLTSHLDSTPVNQRKEPDFLSLRLSLARAHQGLSEKLKVSSPKDSQISKGYSEAKKLALFVARIPSKFQKPARVFLTELPGGKIALENIPAPKTFVEARNAGKEALNSAQVATDTAPKIAARIKAEKNPKLKAELKKLYDEAVRTISTGRVDAIGYFRLALKLMENSTPIEDVNLVQYFLCYLHYIQGSYYDSAVMGELLARQYPESSGARQGAKIAMACYLKLYQENQKADKSFETRRLIRVADYISYKWPNQPEAVDALNTLIPFMIKEGNLVKANEYLQKIPVNSMHRGKAELKTGQALWSSYLDGMKKVRDWEKDGPPQGINLAAEKTRLEKLQKLSQTTLVNGVSRMQKTGNVDSTTVTAVLSLAQIYVDTNQPDKAITLLENPTIGTLTLVKKKHPATTRQGFAEETYKTALRAYISSLANSKQSAAIIKKAKATMASLKQSVGPSAQGQKKLVSIYISLARDLEEQIKLSPPQKKPALLNGFETFLKQVSAEASELNVLNWVAETFFSMGEGLDSGKGAPSANAKKYYTQAIVTYKKILASAKKDPAYLESQMQYQVQMRLATAKRRLGQYKEALDDFQKILTENNMMLNVQVEAALTYQEWARTGKSVLYDRAIKGGRQDKRKTIDGKANRSFNKYIIWGWARLAEMTANSKKFSDTFNQSRYHLALCRYNLAMRKGKESSKAVKQKYLKLAKQDIWFTKQLYRTMGGEKWEPKYNALYKRIQKELGEKQEGLDAIKSGAKR